MVYKRVKKKGIWLVTPKDFDGQITLNILYRKISLSFSIPFKVDAHKEVLSVQRSFDTDREEMRYGKRIEL